jgi:hypothetical protein
MAGSQSSPAWVGKASDLLGTIMQKKACEPLWEPYNHSRASDFLEQFENMVEKPMSMNQVNTMPMSRVNTMPMSRVNTMPMSRVNRIAMAFFDAISIAFPVCPFHRWIRPLLKNWSMHTSTHNKSTHMCGGGLIRNG